jgi:hypothetical protein
MKAVTSTLSPIADHLHDANAGPLPDLTFEAFAQARGFALLGSDEVRELYDDVFSELLAFGRMSGNVQTRRSQYRAVETAALAFEARIFKEMSPA